MRLVRWSVRGVPGVRDGEWRFEGQAASSLLVALGPPASGKTRWLSSLAAHKESVAPYGATSWIRELLGTEPAFTSADWALTSDERRFGAFPADVSTTQVNHAAGTFEADPGMVAIFDRYDAASTLGRLFWIPAHRLPLRAPPSLGDANLGERMLAASPDAAKLGASVARLRTALRAGEQGGIVADVQRLLAAMETRLELRGVNGAGELECHIGGGRRVPLGRLAASEAQAVLLATHVAVGRPRNAVILVDAPETDLGPSVAAGWLQALRLAEPSNQWIVATSDRAIAGLADAQVIDLAARRTS